MKKRSVPNPKIIQAVIRAIDYHGSQARLADAMNECGRVDGRKTHQTDVARWLRGRPVHLYDAMWIHKSTKGTVNVHEFHPHARDAIMPMRRSKRVRKAA